MGGNSDYKYFLLELHYDNPNGDIGFIDKIKLKFYGTKNLRKNELGVLMVGKAGTWAQLQQYPTRSILIIVIQKGTATSPNGIVSLF